MVRHVDGTCVYFSQDWYVSEVEVCLRLLPNNPLPLEAVTEIASYAGTQNKFPSNLKSPWGKKWIVSLFMYPEDENLLGGPIREIVTSITLKTNKVNPKTFFPLLKKMLSKEFLVLYNGTEFRLLQELLPYCKFKENISFTDLAYPEWVILLNKTNMSTSKTRKFNKMYKVAPKMIERLVMNIASIPMHITKLFFCEQIELSPSQIEIYQYVYIQVIIYKNMTYLPDEFLKVEGRGRQTAHYRICAHSIYDDSVFSRSTAVHHDFLNLILIFVILLFFW